MKRGYTMIEIILIGLIIVSLLVTFYGIYANANLFVYIGGLFLMMIGFYMANQEYNYRLFLIPIVLGVLIIFYDV
jgi:hypothetical membrane protein